MQQSPQRRAFTYGVFGALGVLAVVTIGWLGVSITAALARLLFGFGI